MTVDAIYPRPTLYGAWRVNLIPDALPFGRLWYTKPDHAIDYAKFRSRSHDPVIRVYDEAGNGHCRQLLADCVRVQEFVQE